MSGRDETRNDPSLRRREPVMAFRAVAFADIVGSTALAEAHELEAFRCVRRVLGILRRMARRCGGRVVDEAGDGALVAFTGASEAALWAARCHAEVARQRVWPPCRGDLRLRIGLHAGPVLVFGSRLFGQTVTIACRLQQAAGPGETLVSAPVRDLLGAVPAINVSRVPDVPLKGTARRITSYRLDMAPVWSDLGHGAGAVVIPLPRAASA